MKKETALYYLPRIFLVALFIGTTVFFLLNGGSALPEKIVSKIGIQNSYWIIFVLAFFGGRLAFSAIPYHVILITLATGGLNPFLLGFASALGVTVGDAASYFVGYQGSVLIPQTTQKTLRSIYAFGLRHPKILPLLFFFQGALSPVSNDFFTVPMGFSRYPFWHILIPLGLGNLVFNTGIALLTANAYGFFQGAGF